MYDYCTYSWILQIHSIHKKIHKHLLIHLHSLPKCFFQHVTLSFHCELESGHDRRVQIRCDEGWLACLIAQYSSGLRDKVQIISRLPASSTTLINKSCQLQQQFVMTDVFFHLTSRTTSQLQQVCMLWGCQHPVMTAAVEMQTSAHSGVIFEPLKLGQVV